MKKELSIDVGLRIQKERLEQVWKPILKDSVYKRLVEIVTKDNSKAKTGLDVCRGSNIDYIVSMLYQKTTWEYSLITNTIWASFDHGTVKAITYDEAKEIAIEKIKRKLNDVNTVLSENNSTFSSIISMDFSQIELKEVTEK